MRAILSIVVALVLSVAGHLVLWRGADGIVSTRAAFVYADPAGMPLLLLVVGLALVLASIGTLLWSRIGVLVVGAAQLALALTAIVLALVAPGGAVALALARVLADASGGTGLLTVATGVTAVTGATQLATALLTRELPRTRLWQAAVAVVVAFAAGPLGLMLAITGGAGIEMALGIGIPARPEAALELLGGVVLVVLVLVPLRWSASGAIVLGGATLVAGVVPLVAPNGVTRVVEPLWLGLSLALQTVGITGGVVLMGTVVLGLGIVTALRRRRRTRG